MDKSNTAAEDKDLWATPKWVVDFAEAFFGFKFDLDVCALPHNAKAPNFITPDQDTLKADWQGRFCWFNPPYSNPLPFVLRAIEQSAAKNKHVVMLLNADSSTKWFDLCIRNAQTIVYIVNGRIPFIHNATGEPVRGNNKPQMLVYFAPKAAFGSLKTEYVSINQMRQQVEDLK